LIISVAVAGVVLAGVGIGLKCIASAGAPVAAIMPPPALPAVPPASLINDLQERIRYLQQRITGVNFYIYTVRRRENLWRIAARHRYSVHSLIGCNPQLQTYDVSEGDKVLVPSKGGTLHIVQPHETWQNIADRYKTTVSLICSVNSGVSSLVSGELVFIPGKMPDIKLMNEKMRARYEMRELFDSPLGGRLSSFFGKRKHPVTGGRSFHGGIDIAVREGTWVGAAAAGKVILAASDVGHYGKAVFIDHGNGYVTHYGHLSKIYVREGQSVKARQLIAKSGSTGRSTGPHLHFTIKKNGTPVDPLRYIW
jgi:LysM repeat protein